MNINKEHNTRNKSIIFGNSISFKITLQLYADNQPARPALSHYTRPIVLYSIQVNLFHVHTCSTASMNISIDGQMEFRLLRSKQGLLVAMVTL